MSRAPRQRAAGVLHSAGGGRPLAALLRAVQLPTVWACRYARQAALKAAREAEAARQQAAAEAEAEAARLRQERRQKERPLREVVGWIKAAARAPAEAPTRPTVVQRAQRAARLVGHLTAQAGDHP